MRGHHCHDWWEHDSCQLTEETFVEVWSAHLVGSFWHPPGETSDAFIRRAVGDFRSSCDLSNPRAIRRRIARGEALFGQYWRSEYWHHGYQTHFPGVRMVDQMDALCRQYRDPQRLMAEFQRQFIHPEEPARTPASTTTATAN